MSSPSTSQVILYTLTVGLLTYTYYLFSDYRYRRTYYDVHKLPCPVRPPFPFPSPLSLFPCSLLRSRSPPSFLPSPRSISSSSTDSDHILNTFELLQPNPHRFWGHEKEAMYDRPYPDAWNEWTETLGPVFRIKGAAFVRSTRSLLFGFSFSWRFCFLMLKIGLIMIEWRYRKCTTYNQRSSTNEGMNERTNEGVSIERLIIVIIIFTAHTDRSGCDDTYPYAQHLYLLQVSRVDSFDRASLGYVSIHHPPSPPTSYIFQFTSDNRQIPPMGRRNDARVYGQVSPRPFQRG